MTEEERPDPEILLAALTRQEKQHTGGELKIFFGMSAGVGKTYKMLEEAQKLQKEGVDVVVGTINTHGRIETAKLLEGLKIIPEKWISYKDTVFEEFDIDEVLKLKPQLVLLDELAHTNVPGSRHPKRWQDLLELLDAGINIFTTLNVQHVESLKEIVEAITGIQIRETVPDLILERATQIEIVDITPTELLQRLKEGKVYLGDQSQIAAQHFFKEDRLTALREIALRVTAEKVDHDLHGLLSQGLSRGWKARERLLVAVGPSPYSQQLIRAAKRLAFELDAPWIAAHIDTGTVLNDEDQARLANNLKLADALGAEVMTTTDNDIVTALQRIARQKNISQILIGRPSTFSLWNPFKENIVSRLIKENVNTDIIIVRQDSDPYVYGQGLPSYHLSSSLTTYAMTLILGALAITLGSFLAPFIGYKAVGFGFLFSILVLSLFVGQGPIFLAAILSASSWYFLFVPPTTADSEDLAILVLYLFTATIMGILTSRIKESKQLISLAEERTGALYEIEKEIAGATSLEQMRQGVTSHLETIFPGEFDILAAKIGGQLEIESHLLILNLEKEKAVATWVFQNGKMAGWSTDTLPSANCIYFPIKGLGETLGILVYHPRTHRTLSLNEMNFLETVNQQISAFLQRFSNEEKVKLATFTTQVEKMHDAIFHAFSRVFLNPLAKIVKITQILQNEAIDPGIRTKSLKQITKSTYNLQRVANNIITMSKLSSGFIHFHKDLESIQKLIHACLNDLETLKGDHPIEVLMPPNIPLAVFDFSLLELALNNLLINAIEYSLPNAPITIKVVADEKSLLISVIDEGPGIPLKVLPLVFQKFYQIHVPGSHSEGIGLGLAVSKAVVELHKGNLDIKNLDKGGVIASISLPLE